VVVRWMGPRSLPDATFGRRLTQGMQPMSEQPTSYKPRHVVVLAHPNPSSFNALVADAYCQSVMRCGQEPSCATCMP
jgi:hypothetical protein